MGTGTAFGIAALLSAVAVGVIFAPGWAAERRSANSRAGPRSIGYLCAAEADYRHYDRDGNGIHDYWTGDVAGLYRYGMLPREIAEADTAPLNPLVPTPIPYKGWYFRALVADDFRSPSQPYRKYTDLTSGAVHNLEHFGFVAYPASGLFADKYMWIVNENNTSMRSPMDIPVPVNFPTEQELKSHWAKLQ